MINEYKDFWTNQGYQAAKEGTEEISDTFSEITDAETMQYWNEGWLKFKNENEPKKEKVCKCKCCGCKKDKIN